MKRSRFPAGWDEARVRRVLEHYERQTEDEEVAEDEAAFESRGQTVPGRTQTAGSGYHATNRATSLGRSDAPRQAQPSFATDGAQSTPRLSVQRHGTNSLSIALYFFRSNPSI
jgi:hypothetical protein